MVCESSIIPQLIAIWKKNKTKLWHLGPVGLYEEFVENGLVTFYYGLDLGLVDISVRDTGALSGVKM